MWPAIAANMKFLVSFFGTLCEQRIITTFWYRVDTITGGAAPTIKEFFDTANVGVRLSALHNKYLDCVPDNYTLDQTRMQVIAPDRYVAIKYAEGVTGNVGFDATTANVSATITRQNLVADRHNVARISIPIAAPSDTVDGGKLTAFLIARLELLAAQMRGTISEVIAGTTVTAVPCQVWRSGLPGGYSARDLLTTTVQDTCRVMRRRTVRLGE